ncbi:MAG: hypothetical protein PHC34_11000, partial [Candidatus Gastranaerophilales bacterium]|nr:hypothetical protein [Candidatus Gastranaerophilales bacterium]
MQITLNNICLRNVYFPRIKAEKENTLKNPQTRQNLAAFPSFKVSRAYAVISFGQNLPENYSTVQSYKELVPDQKAQLRDLVQKYLSNNETYSNDEGLVTLENVTNEIINKFKDQRLVSLGRSPIPFLEMAKAMKNGINDYKFVAFSQGKILHSINSDHWQICKKNPTERQLDCYREY